MQTTDKFSQNLKTCLQQAIKKAKQSNSKSVDINHFLLAVFNQQGSLAYDLMRQKKFDTSQLETLLIKKNTLKPEKQTKTLQLSEELKNILIKATILAHKKHHRFIGTEHCLMIFLETMPTDFKFILSKTKINIEQLKKQIFALLKGNSKFPEITKHFHGSPDFLDNQFPFGNLAPKNILEQFAVNLTDKKLQKNINPVIGREKELQRLIQILCRKDKNNPVILGDPGVGKTALVEGLAKKIINKEVPNILLDKKIYALDLSLIVAGTMYRGDFEQRLKSILDEIKKNPDTIIFIDELHNIMGAGGSNNGAMDAANILKPLLARGELRCIGATTLEEYKKHIEKDSALDRRFQPIILAEPTAEQTFDILQGIKNNYENYHQVIFTEQAINQAINLSRRYIFDKLLPDKAIDLLDEAAAKININKKQGQLQQQIAETENYLKKILREKEQAIIKENFNLAINFKIKEKTIRQKLNQLLEKQKAQDKQNYQQITVQDIFHIISQKTNIPVEVLKQNKQQKLKNIWQQIQRQVVGQDNVLNEIFSQLNRSSLGLTDENKPLASFLFIGPSGTGKTFMAKQLARHFFEHENSLVKIDMSEFSDKINSSKLLGAPAGYVGYRENNLLADAVKKNPYCLVLFDEIEKAHPDIINLLLQVLEDGFLTDAIGKKIDFHNTIIIMTSNIGAELFNKKATIGFGNEDNQDELKKAILNQAQKHFRPEFINRIDKICLFNNLGEKDLHKIINLELEKLSTKFKNKNINLNFTKNNLQKFARQAMSLNIGARAVTKIIDQHLDKLLMEKIKNA